jgi:hypothetical protein
VEVEAPSRLLHLSGLQMGQLLVREVLISNLQLSVPVAAINIETRVRAQKSLVSSSLKVGAGSAISANSPTTPHRVDLVRTTTDKQGIRILVVQEIMYY